jgi:hypothetical protein
MNGDSISLRNIRPDRIENAVPYLLPTDAFETYEAGSGIINVTAPGHGLTNGDTKRFRGAPLATTASGGSFQFTNPESFDGISGSNIAKAAGYTITTGLYVNDARVSTDYAVANFFFFTVDTDTATKGGVTGGGNGCSVGPVTLSA